MAVSVKPSVLALVGTGRKSVGGQLRASGLLLLSGYQDIGLRAPESESTRREGGCHNLRR